MYLSICIGIAIIAVVILGFSGSVKSVLDIVGKYVSYFSGPALGAFLLAMLTRKANDKGVSIAFIVGFVVGYIIARTFNTSWLVNPAIGCTITLVLGYILSCVFHSDKTEEELDRYTLQGLRAKLIAEGKDMEDGVSVIPFKLDKYAVILLVLFFAQYAFLALIR